MVFQIGFKYWVSKFSFRSNIADMSLAIFFPWCIGSMVWHSICIIWHIGPSTSKLLSQLLVTSWDTVSVNYNGKSKWDTFPCNSTNISMIRTPLYELGGPPCEFQAWLCRYFGRFLCHRNFNNINHLSPFHSSLVVVWRLCRLSEFTPYRALWYKRCGRHSPSKAHKYLLSYCFL